MDAPISLPDVEDAGMEPDEDAGMSTPPPECGPQRDTCGSARECIAGQCRAVDITGSYTLTILSASVPPRPSLSTCYDPDVWCSFGSCDGTCQPDPYVVVTKNGVLRVGSTSTQADTTKPVWMGPQLAVQLSAGDTLLFAVYDSDTFGNAEIYSCSPALPAQIRSGSLRCAPSTRADGNYEVVASIARR